MICPRKHSLSLYSALLEHFNCTCSHSNLPLLSSGVTFSFFWKTQDQQAKLLPASGGRVISSGFKICSNEGEGSVEFYTRGNAMMKWKASFSPPGKVYNFLKLISLFYFTLFLERDVVRAQLQEREELCLKNSLDFI